MHKEICILIVFIFLLPPMAINGELEGKNVIAPDMMQMIKRSHYVIFDVRTSEEYAKEHIEGAISLPLSKLLCKSCLNDIIKNYKEMQIFIYGNNSKLAADILSKNGLKNIFILDGGMQKWKKEGFSVVSSDFADAYFTGCIPPKESDSKEDLLLPAYLPPQWDWRNVDGKDWTTPVKNQGRCGSCWDFAAMGALESVIKIEENSSIFNPDLSEQYLLSCPPDSGGCSGWSAYYAYDYILKNGGAIPEDCFQYRANDNIPCSSKCSDWQEKLVPITDFGIKYNPGRDYMKYALIEYGPMVVCMAVYDDFFSYKGGIYEHPGYEPPDDINHEVVLVGYNDNPGYWICKNSWGENWGENGFFKMAYGDCQIEYYIIYVKYDPSSRNWPPVADAGGPYMGKIGEDITFDGSGSYDADDNILSYSWNFGDGSSGEGVNPKHHYSHEGKFTARLTVTDAEGEYGVDEAMVYIDETPPTVEIEKPKERFLYILDTEIMSLLFKTRIIGGITIEASATDTISEISKVEFYLDDELMETDYEWPYQWYWGKSSFGNHVIKVIAYDSAGNSASDEMKVWVMI